MRVDPIETALAALDEIEVRSTQGQKQVAKALAAKSNLIVAKAARLVGEAQLTNLTGELVAAFERFRKRGSELDKGCVAMSAIARALYGFDYAEADLYLNGIRHVQMEPVWGGSIDTAVELRALCAMGLAGTAYPQKLRALVELLVDKESQARAGAVRALAAVGSEAALLLLRFKALSGDREPDVLGDCFHALLAVEGSDALPLVTSFAVSRDAAIRDSALLALGASRRADAVDWLKIRFAETADRETRHSILLSLATSRTGSAIDFLLKIIREESVQTSAVAVSVMEMSGDAHLRNEAGKALEARAARQI
jgi:hypothetical protein